MLEPAGFLSRRATVSDPKVNRASFEMTGCASRVWCRQGQVFRMRHICVAVAALLAVTGPPTATPGSAQAVTPPPQTIMVPMADGVKLATDIYLPPGPGPFPTVVARTPYKKDFGKS